MAGKIIFVTGGARSGKSRFALQEAAALAGKKAFIATACAGDEEMAQRIARHRMDRGKEWDTFEEPLRVAALLPDLAGRYSVIVIDCLTLWLSNVMCSDLVVEEEMGKLKGALAALASPTVYIVSNEVGSGIVPDNELARRFRDLAGMLNQQTAGLADEVHLLVAGIPMKIKGERHHDESREKD